MTSNCRILSVQFYLQAFIRALNNFQHISFLNTSPKSILDTPHPGCQALFISDQSSAHASLLPDAPQAFDMEKSNGGKQHMQQDTVIPQSNPDPHYCGQPQSMVTASGKEKELKQVLEEWGFNISN